MRLDCSFAHKQGIRYLAVRFALRDESGHLPFALGQAAKFSFLCLARRDRSGGWKQRQRLRHEVSAQRLIGNVCRQLIDQLAG